MRNVKKLGIKDMIKILWHSVLIWSVLIVGGLLTGFEVSARLNVFNQIFPFRNLGMSETIFQLKWQRIKEFQEVRGNVDALIFGSSLVNTGVDPDEVTRIFSEETGYTFNLFNYGVEGFTIESSELASQILVNTFHPSLIIIGTEMRDYYAVSGTAAHQDFVPAAWTLYQTGEFSPFGFLISHSVALQVALSVANWMMPDFIDNYHSGIYRYNTMNLTGYECDYAVNLSVNQPVELTDPQEQHLQDLYLGFEANPDRIAALQLMITNLTNQGISVVVLDMPINPTALTYYGGEAEYQAYHALLQQTVVEAGGIYIPAPSPELIPEDGWANRHHLNVNGAPVFSQYIGRSLAELYLAHAITLSVTEQ